MHILHVAEMSGVSSEQVFHFSHLPEGISPYNLRKCFLVCFWLSKHLEHQGHYSQPPSSFVSHTEFSFFEKFPCCIDLFYFFFCLNAFQIPFWASPKQRCAAWEHVINRIAFFTPVLLHCNSCLSAWQGLRPALPRQFNFWGIKVNHEVWSKLETIIQV